MTESDFWTFVVPDSLFGVLSALAGPLLTTTTESSLWGIFQRIPLAMLSTWLNLILFQLANQRLARDEDVLNKPHRPIPAGLLTPLQMQRILLCAVPTVLAISYFLDTLQESLVLVGLTWMYNDLGGGDESFIVRNLIIAIAFAVYNIGALRVICNGHSVPNISAYKWTFLISLIIFSTMSIQDLKDQPGDQARGRSTSPLVLGDKFSRWTLAIPMVFWSLFCPFYIGVAWPGFIVPLTLGLLVAVRLLVYRTPRDDQRTWDAWAGWLISVYCLPLVKSHVISLF